MTEDGIWLKTTKTYISCTRQLHVDWEELVSWSLTSPFSTNMAISEKRLGGELSLPSEGRLAIY